MELTDEKILIQHVIVNRNITKNYVKETEKENVVWRVVRRPLTFWILYKSRKFS
jgi:hypothetical protein